MTKGEKSTALRILSNISEMELENYQLLRILAKRLEQLEFNHLAISIYREILELREEEPQSYRDLGLALAKVGKYQESIKHLYNVITTKWDSRFPKIELIALNELNNIIVKSPFALKTSFIDKRFLKNLPMDIRVVMEWDADNTDIDLWVIDPNKEKCYYSHKNTKIRGRISNDFTGGYGPEVFMLKDAIKGSYTIKANFYGHSQQKITGFTTIQVKFIRDFGLKTETVKEVTVRLKNRKDVITIDEFKI